MNLVEVLNVRFELPLNEARNYTLLVMVLLQNVHAFNCRSEKNSAFKIPLKNNRFIVYAVGGALALHLTCMYIPFMQVVLETNPITFIDFIIAVFMTLPLLFIMESFKLFNESNRIKKSVNHAK